MIFCSADVFFIAFGFFCKKINLMVVLFW